MVNISKCNIKRQERLDEHGKPFFDAPRINMQLILGKRVVVDKIVSGIKTKQGEGRYALRVQFMGDSYKLIVNAVDIKNFLADMERCHVTKFSTVFVDNGSMHYSVDEKDTDIIEVCGRTVKEHDGHIVYEDDGTEVIFE